MLKKAYLYLLLSAILLILCSCESGPSVGEAGTLPRNWWNMDRGRVQNYYRKSATGLEGKVVIFLGKSDSGLNIDESTAVENARMDAFQQLSRYLSMKVTGIQQSGKHIQAILDAEDKGILTKAKGDELIKKVNLKMSDYNASITSTQFSSFKQEGTHTEKGGNKLIGYVCYSMTEKILEQTRELQNEAFKTLIAETAEYQAIMKNIQEVIAQKMLETIMDEAGLPK